MASSTLARGTMQLSLARVLWRDLVFVVASGLLLVSWLIAGLLWTLGYIPLYVGRLVFTPQEITVLLIGVAVFTVLALPVVFWRWSHFHDILARGVLVQGQLVRRKVTAAQFHLEAAYHFQGRPFRVHNRVRRNRNLEHSPSLEPGRTVHVLVHQFLPENALIYEVYHLH